MITFFTRLFGKKEQRVKDSNSAVAGWAAECTEIQELSTLLQQLLTKNHYIARSEYLGTTQ